MNKNDTGKVKQLPRQLRSYIRKLSRITALITRRVARVETHTERDVCVCVCVYGNVQWSRGLAGARCVSRCRTCLLYTSPSPRDGLLSRMPSSA